MWTSGAKDGKILTVAESVTRNGSALALMVALAGCKADRFPISDAHGTIDMRCTGPYADLIVDSFQVQNASAALGAPDAMTASLGVNSILTVAFTQIGAITDAPGTDLKIDATVSAGGSAVVRLAGSDEQFKYAAMLDATNNQVDVAAAFLLSAQYVRVTVNTGTIAIDAFEATHDQCR